VNPVNVGAAAVVGAGVTYALHQVDEAGRQGSSPMIGYGAVYGTMAAGMLMHRMGPAAANAGKLAVQARGVMSEAGRPIMHSAFGTMIGYSLLVDTDGTPRPLQPLTNLGHRNERSGWTEGEEISWPEHPSVER
jgi:hypothetical protein